MDIFNKKKIAELESKISELEKEVSDYRIKEKERNQGKHKTGAWCNGCGNLVTDHFGSYPSKFCILDSECKDRKV